MHFPGLTADPDSPYEIALYNSRHPGDGGSCLFKLGNGKAPSNTDVKPAAPQFTDVKEGEYYADAVNWAVENGVTNGTSETTFGPDGVCTRGQIVTLLHRAYVPDARLK